MKLIFDNIQEIREFLEMYGDTTTTEPEKEPKKELKKKSKKSSKADENSLGQSDEMEKESKETKKSDNTSNNITLEFLRSKMTELIKLGKSDLAKSIVKNYGVNKLPDVNQNDYEKLLKEIEENL